MGGGTSTGELFDVTGGFGAVGKIGSSAWFTNTV
jgi:hypothetical protein